MPEVLYILKHFFSLVGFNLFFRLYSRQQFHSTSFQLASKEFNDAKERLGTLTEDPGSDVKLKIYALFKQVSLFDNITKILGW